MRSCSSTRWVMVLACLAALVSACGDDDAPARDAGRDAAPPDGGDADATVGPCTDAVSCSDGVFCNGLEQCAPTDLSADSRGCVAAAMVRCRATQTCDEEQGICVSNCDVNPDADADGYDDARCGGDDCDDSSAAAHPGGTEVCDAANADEDCDFRTNGGLDADADGAFDAACCNTNPLGEQICGADCDDTRADVGPTGTEVCNGRDDDCNGTADDGVALSFYRDADGDRFGDPAVVVMACAAPGGYVADNTDCDDTSVARRPDQVEVCDGLDNNCNGVIDEEMNDVSWYADTDGDGYGAAGGDTVISCSPVAGHSLVSSDCDDTSAARHPAALETCDGTDQDCNGLLDGPGEDDDRDGYADLTCGGDDCDDTDVAVHPGAPEICDRRDSDCSAGGGVDTTEDVDDDGYAPSGGACSGGPLPATDCNDTDPAIHPGASETCNGIDDDCNGSIDEEPAASIDCPTPGEPTACRAGRCVVASCAGPRADCDLDSANGCETDTLTSSPNCGGCGRPCTGATMCAGGTCIVALATHLAGGASHTCAVLGSGGVACWGNNFNGQIGDGTTVTPRLGPTAALGVLDAIDVVAGAAHTCAVLSSGHVLCWGVNTVGQLGDGTTSNHTTATEVSGLTDAVEIASGPAHVCARRTGGGVVCWGSNLSGQLGDGTTTNRLLPTPVVGLSDAVELVTGAAQSCARRAGGTVVCWGENLNGELGDGTTTRRLLPTPVVGLTSVAEIATGAGGKHACARRTTGELLCWGSNANGEVGDGTTTNRTTPVAVSGLDMATSLSVGGRDTSGHTCATVSTGELSCWGGNMQGQLGDGSTTSRSAPVTVSGLADIVEVAAGGRHTCARRVGGTVVCWGANTSGQLGDGTIVNRLTPVAVTGWPP